MRIHLLLVASLAVSFASSALYNPVHNLAVRAPFDPNEEGGDHTTPLHGPLPPLRIPAPPTDTRFTLSLIRELVKKTPNYATNRISVSMLKPKDTRKTGIWNDMSNRQTRTVHVYYGSDLATVANIRMAENGGDTVYAYRAVDAPSTKPGPRSQRRLTAFMNWAKETAKKPQTAVQNKIKVNRAYLNLRANGIPPYEAVTEAEMMRLVKMMTGDGDTVYLHFDPAADILAGEPWYQDAMYQGYQQYVEPVLNGAGDEAEITPRRARLVHFEDESLPRPQRNGKLPGTPPRIGKRDSIITTISTDVDSTNTTNDATTEFQLIWDAFQTVQSNISDTIFPFLDAMIKNTNSSLLYEAAWSIWADLTASNEYTAGPFSNGMYSLDALEDAYLKANNVTESDPTFQNMLVVNAILLDAYTTTWNQAFAAVNGSGLMQQLQTLGGYLLANDTSVQPALFTNVNQTHYDDGWFLVNNHNATNQ